MKKILAVLFLAPTLAWAGPPAALITSHPLCVAGQLPEQWLMHDGSGSTFADATCNDNTITATDITWGTGTGVTSPTFNGTTSTGAAAQTTITNFDGTKPFSVSVWINPGGTGAQQSLVSTLVNTAPYTGWGFQINSAQELELYLINDYQSNAIDVFSGSSSVVPPNVVYNVIATYDGSQTAEGVNFYIDGTVAASPVISKNTLSASTASGNPITVGSDVGGSANFTGSMSNLQIFSGVLTSGQIAAIQSEGP